MRLPVRAPRGERPGLRAAALLGLAAFTPAAEAQIPTFTNSEILEEPSYFRLRSLGARYTHFEQWGRGFQSRAGPVSGPGSQALTVEQPQLEAVIEQGEDLVHRFLLPVDIVTAASPDAVDVVSTASAMNEAVTLDWTISHGENTHFPVSAQAGFHSEENYRSYSFGLAGALSLAEGNTVIDASATQLVDYFDRYLLDGKHDGFAPRSGTNASAGVTQILSPWTVGHLDYGITYQQGQLSNTWNIVPSVAPATRTLTRVLEVLPPTRTRHAAVARVAQWLPWNGALKVSYRFYADDWDVLAHSAELEIEQRLHPYFHIGALYRIHTQTAASFYVDTPALPARHRTADSDLAAFDAHTVGGKAAMDLPVSFSFARRIHAEVAVERYFRTNDLEMMVYTCELGFSR
jgi:hypothetical protein